jgi:uncharacterized membrane protein YbhN (UPF0104 family)
MSAPNPADGAHPAARRRHWIGAAKALLAVGILAFLFYRLRGAEGLVRLVHEPKQWGLLALGQALVIVGLSLNYVRWWVLVRALGLNFSLGDAFRLGSLGFLISQVAPGSVGGDLFKAVFVAREQPGQRTEAVASVLIDRVVGLYAMLLVATFGRLLAGGVSIDGPVAALANVVAALTIVGSIGIALLMTPPLTGPAMQEWVRRLPIAGATLGRLVEAAAAYRSERRYLFAAIAIGCGTHTMFVLAIWLIGRGLPVHAPTLSETFLVGPLSLSAGALPLTPSGLGVAEAAMGQLFKALSYSENDGLLVGLAYRVMTYVMAAVGGVYYVNARRTVAQVLHEAEELAEEEAAADDHR